MELYYSYRPWPKYTSKYGHKPIHFSNLPCNIQKHIFKLQRVYSSYNWREIYDATGIVGVYTLEKNLKAIEN